MKCKSSYFCQSANANDSIVFNPSSKFTSDNSELGINMDDNDSQNLKVLDEISFNELDSLTFTNESQYRKVSWPIILTESGIVIDVNDEQPKKTCSWISTNELESWQFLILHKIEIHHYLKQQLNPEELSIRRTELEIVISSKFSHPPNAQ